MAGRDDGTGAFIDTKEVGSAGIMGGRAGYGHLPAAWLKHNASHAKFGNSALDRFPFAWAH
jgi:hypothetical protein